MPTSFTRPPAGPSAAPQPQSGGWGRLGEFFSGLGGRASDFRANNPGALSFFGAGFAGDNYGKYLATMGQQSAGDQVAQRVKGYMQRQYGLSEDDARVAAQSQPVMNDVFTNPFNQYKQKSEVLKAAGVDPLSPEGKRYLLGGTSGLYDTSYGKTPQLVRDPKTGKLVYALFSDDGTMKIIDTQGYEPQGPVIEYDTKTHHIVAGRDGTIISSTPIENRKAAADTAIGTKLGEQAATAYDNIASADDALYTLAQIKNSPDIELGTGWSSFGNILPGTPGYDFQRLVNQASSGAFLTAIQKMQGLGALSNAEGETARQAVTRMNTATSKPAFLQAVADYERIVRRAKQKAERMAQEYDLATPSEDAPAGEQPERKKVGDRWAVRDPSSPTGWRYED